MRSSILYFPIKRTLFDDRAMLLYVCVMLGYQAIFLLVVKSGANVNCLYLRKGPRSQNSLRQLLYFAGIILKKCGEFASYLFPGFYHFN